MLLLRSGDWEAEVRPEVGGAIGALRHNGADLLRPMAAASRDPLEAACFPLVPYCNRIRNGRFSVGGREVQLPLNFPPESHSLHGLGWQRAWHVESLDEAECVLIDDYDSSSAWPWAYRAQQRIRLDSNGCVVTLMLANRSDQPMLAGLGLHPYFRRRTETIVSFIADHVLLSGADPIPTGVSAPASHFADFSAGSRLPVETVDHCFADWRGEVVVTDDLGRIVLSADGARHLHLYAPADGSVLCLEPVTHTPDASNRAPEEMLVLLPGDAASLTMRISAA